MTNTNLPPQKCPKCQQLTDLIDPEPEPVAPEDVVVCARCGAILILDQELAPQIITDEQITDFRTNAGSWGRLLKIKRAVKLYSQTHKL